MNTTTKRTATLRDGTKVCEGDRVRSANGGLATITAVFGEGVFAVEWSDGKLECIAVSDNVANPIVKA